MAEESVSNVLHVTLCSVKLIFIFKKQKSMISSLTECPLCVEPHVRCPRDAMQGKLF